MLKTLTTNPELTLKQLGLTLASVMLVSMLTACGGGGSSNDNTATDTDGDGVADSADAFPNDAAESVDTDGDGIGNNKDTDDDGDGVADSSDAFPLDKTETLDTDKDGIGNNKDTDDDGDGVPDTTEVTNKTHPLKADTDGDGVNDKDDAYPLDPTKSSSGSGGTVTKTFSGLDATGAVTTNKYEMACMQETRSDGKVMLWELKSDGSSTDGTDQTYNDKDYGYSWGSGGPTSGPASSGILQGTYCSGVAKCDTDSYVAYVNSKKVCGSASWRLPTQAELQGIASATKNTANGTYINTNFGINNVWPGGAVAYWSSTTSGTGKAAISYDVANGQVMTHDAGATKVNFVRLVADK